MSKCSNLNNIFKNMIIQMRQKALLWSKGIRYYYIPITDTTLELSVFWLSDLESQINELRFSESISLSFKTRLTSVICFCGDDA